MDAVISMIRAGSTRCFDQLALSPINNPSMSASEKMKFLFFKILIINTIFIVYVVELFLISTRG